MSTQAMKQALEAITYLMAGSYRSGNSGPWARVSVPKDKALDMGAAAIESLRTALQSAQAGEPVLTVEKEPDYWSGGHFCEGTRPHINPTKVWSLPIGTKLYTHPAPGVPDDVVRVPLQVLKDASEAIGNFVSDHGWGESDMQAMDNLDAYIARHATAYPLNTSK